MDKKQILIGIVVALLGAGAYFFKDKLFTGGSDIETKPVWDHALIKTTLIIDSVTKEQANFRVTFEAKKDVEITALRAFYFDKKRTSKTRSNGSKSSSSRISSEEMGNLDLTDGKITLKAGEKTEIAAHFTLSEVQNTHYIEITGKVDEPCPPDMAIEKCMEIQMANIMKDDKTRDLNMMEKVKKK
jgi:hypothetical protein